ncbi:hypothetical protein B0H19DRAFT_318882 [Mycena capillaripes]|nr:hypothetical protein B0H19DRAFT_318882 [Mycena capillaripes]
MVLLEGMWLEPSSSSSVPVPPSPMTPGELTLHGTLLARNVAFEKHVFVRFTLDGWCTTSEVGARWVEPASAAESPFGTRWGARSAGPTSTSSSSTPATEEREEPGPGWDRFAFSIRLTDYAHARHTHHSHSGRQEGLRETGVGGIGRGLEGRELVLVGRFWAPWVRSGGVGPYVWCDTLSPSSTTPGTQSGVDVSPVSKRPWVGVGGGGSGEWWDNNGGGITRLGFGVSLWRRRSSFKTHLYRRRPRRMGSRSRARSRSLKHHHPRPLPPPLPLPRSPTTRPSRTAGRSRSRRRRRRVPRMHRRSLRSLGG